MTLWSRLASAMVLLVAATVCVLGLFSNGLAGLGGATLAAGGFALGIAFALATGIARSLSRELSAQLGTRQDLLENTVESIRDAVVVVDEHAVVVVANAAARRLLGVDRGFNSLTGPRKFTCFLTDGVTPLPIPDSPLARALRGENVDDFELVVQSGPARAGGSRVPHTQRCAHTP